MRYTPEREHIVREIFSRHDHFSAEVLLKRLRDNKLNISRASVYRAIPMLIDAGLVNEVYQENGQTFYEHIYGHEQHCHLRCSICGQVKEFSEPGLLRDLIKNLSKTTGYTIDEHRLELMGMCPQCLSQRNKKTKTSTP